MEFLFYLLLAAVGFYICSQLYQGFKAGISGDDARMHCMTCGTDAQATDYTKGSIWIEVVLWLCFIVPGLIYSIWRQTNKATKCPACGSGHLVPQSSPAATNSVSPDTHVKCPDCRELVLKDARKCKHCGCALIPQ